MPAALRRRHFRKAGAKVRLFTLHARHTGTFFTDFWNLIRNFMLYSILKTSINITLVKGETGTTPYLYYIRARRRNGWKISEKIRKGEKSQRKTRTRKGENMLTAISILRFPSQKHTVLVPKTYGFGTENVRSWDQKRKKETSETKKYNTFRIGNNI